MLQPTHGAILVTLLAVTVVHAVLSCGHAARTSPAKAGKHHGDELEAAATLMAPNGAAAEGAAARA